MLSIFAKYLSLHGKNAGVAFVESWVENFLQSFYFVNRFCQNSIFRVAP